MTDKFEVGEKVAVRGLRGLDRNALQIGRVARVLKSFVELEDGSKFSHAGSVYPRREWSTTLLERLTPELEAEHRRQRFVKFLRAVKWDTLDSDALAKIVSLVRE